MNIIRGALKAAAGFAGLWVIAFVFVLMVQLAR